MALNLTKVKEVQRRLISIEDDIIDSSERVVLESLKTISRDLQRASLQFETDNRVVTASQRNLNIASDMIAGLDAALQEIANEGKNQVVTNLAKVTEEIGPLLKAAGFDIPDDFANRIDANVVGTFLNLDLDRFNNGASATTQVLQQGIFGLITGVNTFDEMVDNIKRISEEDNFIAKNAKTWAMSAVISYENTFMQSLLPEEEVGGFYYSGPDDGANRDFCASRVDKVFKPKTIASDVASNPIGNSSMRLPGGWNCRHVLIPVPVDDEEFLKEAV